MPQVILRPNASGDKTEWPHQYPDSSSHWDKVDEETPDDDSTYIYVKSTDIGSFIDLYNIPDLSSIIEPGATINFVRVYIRCRGTAYNVARAAPMVKTYGTEYAPADMTFGTSYETKYHQWDNNPYTGNPWTIDEIYALQIGVRGHRGSYYDPILGIIRYDDTRCTQVYLLVDYTVPPVVVKRLIGDGLVCIVV